MAELVGAELIGGSAHGQLVHADIGLSFWGGVDPLTGLVIDHTHPLHKQSVADKILAIPNGRGSCTGSQVLLELLLNKKAPRAIILRQPDMILALGIIVAQEMFGTSIPMVSVGNTSFDSIKNFPHVSVEGSKVHLATAETHLPNLTKDFSTPDKLLHESTLALTSEEQAMLDGREGEAKRVAMRILARAAAIDGAPELIPVTQVDLKKRMCVCYCYDRITH